MECLLCHKEGHTVFDCDSERAKTMSEAVNHVIMLKLEYFYMYGNRTIESIFESQHFRRLSLGDLIYLNRKWNVREIPNGTREKYICLFLCKMTATLFAINENVDHMQHMLRIDVNYWHKRMTHSVEIATEWRNIQLAKIQKKIPQISYVVLSEDVTKKYECAICFRDDLMESECERYQCSHIFCICCVANCLSTNPICSLCREPISQITRYSSSTSNIQISSVG